MLNDILGLPRVVNGVGNVYPIPLLEYSQFMAYAYLLKYDKKHTYIKNDETGDLEALLYVDFPCEDIIGEIKGQDLVKYKVNCLTLAIEMLTRKPVKYNFDDKTFYIGDDGFLNEFNFYEFKNNVCEQNLIVVERFYKNKKLAERVKALKKNKADKGSMGIEDIISTVSVLASVSYEEISKMTYYQLMHTFGRVNKIKEFELTTKRRLSGDDKCNIVHYTDNLNLGVNNDKELFKEVGTIQKMFS